MSTHATRVRALKALEKANGRLSPEDVVNAARNRRHPLHDDFEWDDAEAANRFRITQAALIIRSVRITVTTGVHKLGVSVPIYTRDFTVDTPHGYRDIMKLREDEDDEAKRAVVVAAMQRVVNAVKSAKSLAVVLDFVEDLDKIDDLARSIMSRIDGDELDSRSLEGRA
jgi:hypothetical protein